MGFMRKFRYYLDFDFQDWHFQDLHEKNQLSLMLKVNFGVMQLLQGYYYYFQHLKAV